MIQLSQTTQKLIAPRLINPPTHAQLHMRHIIPPTTFPFKSGMDLFMSPRLEVLYFYGTLVNGAFTPDPDIDPCHAAVDFSNYSTRPVSTDMTPDIQAQLNQFNLDNIKRQAMLASLLDAGVSPAQDPTKTLVTSNKKQNDCKIADIDAIFAAYEPRLGGTVI